MGPTHQDLPVILHNDRRGLLTVENGSFEVLQLSQDGQPPKKLLTSNVRNFLLARLAPSVEGDKRRLDLHALIVKGTQLSLTKIHVLVEVVIVGEAEKWIETAMKAAYGDTKPLRRVLLLVNPIGGKGKSRQIVKSTVLPILHAAGCHVEVKTTERRSHAEEIAKECELTYDVIACASGDGLINEVFNGLASRPDATAALKIPLAQIPTGSANALTLNLAGPKDTFNIPLACLTVVKGQVMPIDLTSVLFLPSMKHTWSYLMITLGLMVDLDIGTENLRWMGDTRFIVGFIRGVMQKKNHRCRMRLKVVGDDKVEMARRAREQAEKWIGRRSLVDDPDSQTLAGKTDTSRTGDGAASSPDHGETLSGSSARTEAANGHALPASDTRGELSTQTTTLPTPVPLEPDDTWLTIDTGKAGSSTRRKSRASANGNDWVDGDGIFYACAGAMPYMDRDLMQWPTAMPSSGSLDLVVQTLVSRSTMLNAITGAEKGGAYWMDSQKYYKVSAFTCENSDKEKQPIFAVDGESFPYDTFHVQVHARLGNILSLTGHLYMNEFLQRHDSEK